MIKKILIFFFLIFILLVSRLPEYINLIFICTFLSLLLFPLDKKKFRDRVPVLITLYLILTVVDYHEDKSNLKMASSVYLVGEDGFSNLNDLPVLVNNLAKAEFLKIRDSYEYKCNSHQYGCWSNNVARNSFGSINADAYSFGTQSIYSSLSPVGGTLHDINQRIFHPINDLDFNWFDLPMFADGTRSDLKRASPPVLVHFKFPSVWGGLEFCWTDPVLLDSDHIVVSEENGKKCILNHKQIDDAYFFIPPISGGSDFEIEYDTFFFDLGFIKIVTLIGITILILSMFNFVKASPLRLEVFFAYIVALFFVYSFEGDLKHIVFEGGNDGLVHYGFAKEMFAHFLANDFELIARGQEAVFYYMPGARYINFVSLLFFGEGILLLFSMICVLPASFLIAYRTLSDGLKKKNRFILFVLLFITLVFLFQECVAITKRGYGDAASLSLFLLAAALLVRMQVVRYKSNNTSAFVIFLVGLLVSVGILIRPSFSLAGLLVYIYILINCRQITFKNRFSILLLAGLPTLLPFLHNYFFGGAIVVFSSASGISANLLISPQDYVDLIFSDNTTDVRTKLFNHFVSYISYGGRLPNYIGIMLHFSLILLLLKSGRLKNILIFYLIALGSAIPLFFYHNEYRYSLLTISSITICLCFHITHFLGRPNNGRLR